MRTDHVNNTPTLSITVYIMSILFFSFFWLYLHYLPYLEMCTDHVKSTPILSTTVYIMSVLFFSFFPDFLAVCTSITILGDAHSHVNSSEKSPHHPYFFPEIFPIFFFHLKLQNLPYLAIFSFHSGHWIPLPFCSSQFQGLLW